MISAHLFSPLADVLLSFLKACRKRLQAAYAYKYVHHFILAGSRAIEFKLTGHYHQMASPELHCYLSAHPSVCPIVPQE